VAKQCPELTIPTANKVRNRLHQPGDSVRLQASEVRTRHAACHTTMALAVALVEAAIRHKGPLGVGVFDAWDLAEAVVRGLARQRQAWISLLKKHRRLETASVHLREANGGPLQRPSPHIAVKACGPLIPVHASRPVTVREQTDGCATRAVRLPGLGKVRLVVHCEPESWTGRSVVRVTNRVDWHAAKISGLSRHRWPTAPCDQDGQGPLGLDA